MYGGLNSRKGGIAIVLLIILVFLVISSGIAYWLVSKAKTTETMEQAALQEVRNAAALELLNSQGNFSPQKLDKISLNNELELNNLAIKLGINSSQLQELLDSYAKELLSNISTELNITLEQAAQLFLIMEEHRGDYPTLEDEDAYGVVKIDFMNYEERLAEEVQLPEAFMEEPPSAGSQVAIVPLMLSSKTFNELLEEVTGKEIKSELGEEFSDFDLTYFIKNLSNALTNISEVDLEKSFCVLGMEKEVLLRADYLINNKKLVNYAYDQIIYGTDGKIVYELSSKDKKKELIKDYMEEVFLIADRVIIPLNYSEGTYIAEYTIKDNNFGEYRMVRVPLFCHRQLFVPEFYLTQKSELGHSDEIVPLARKDNSLARGEEVQFQFSVAGFAKELENEAEQFREVLIIYNESGSQVGKITLPPLDGFIVGKNSALSLEASFIVPAELPQGDYQLLLKVKDMRNGEVTRSRLMIGVK